MQRLSKTKLFLENTYTRIKRYPVVFRPLDLPKVARTVPINTNANMMQYITLKSMKNQCLFKNESS